MKLYRQVVDTATTKLNITDKQKKQIEDNIKRRLKKKKKTGGEGSEVNRQIADTIKDMQNDAMMSELKGRIEGCDVRTSCMQQK